MDRRMIKGFELMVQSLIIVSLISFSIETLPNLSNNIKSILDAIEICVVVAFTIEYICRIVFSKNRLGFITSFNGIIDILAILPFYIASSLDLRSLRVFRLFRLVRLLKMCRYMEATVKLKKAFVEIKDELVLFAVVAIFVIYISAVGIYYFEHDVQPKSFQSIFHCLWWAVVTLTTVGYGDAYPITIGGKVFTSFMMITGIGVIAVPTGLIASALTFLMK
jgi:voltage-gated potassium channel